MKLSGFIGVAFIVLNHHNCTAQDLPLRGMYFGQVKSDDKAVIFAPGRISRQGRHEYNICFFPSGTAFTYLTKDVLGKVDTAVCKRESSIWTGPYRLQTGSPVHFCRRIKIPFGENASTCRGGKILIFNRSAGDGQQDIYMAVRIRGDEWSEPIALGPAVNTSFDETHPALSPDGKYLFFSRHNEFNGMADLYWIGADIIYQLYKSYSKY